MNIICSWGVTHTVFVTFQAVVHFMKVINKLHILHEDNIYY